MLHQTDLFHPHGDPDDHWDLACVYALAFRGDTRLKGVLIDFPPGRLPGDPDVMAVGQLNLITGMAVPVAEPVEAGRPLPIFMAHGARLKVDVPAGTTIMADMVTHPADSRLWALRAEQDKLFFGSAR